MSDEQLNSDERNYQCEYDLEDRSSRQAAGFAAPYTCAVCGVEAEAISHLCAPEFNPKATDQPPAAGQD
ncbi:MAG: hypothetical protein FVQ81_02795 [Candidatus Glassbacteria bacterium]|nr:hypothetical protein [Candidatus Glassbacteria bacterium]